MFVSAVDWWSPRGPVFVSTVDWWSPRGPLWTGGCFGLFCTGSLQLGPAVVTTVEAVSDSIDVFHSSVYNIAKVWE